MDRNLRHNRDQNIVEAEVAAEVVDKLQHSIIVDKSDKTAKVNKLQLEFSVNNLLSNPQNKRFHTDFEGHSLMDVFTHMTSKLSPDAKVKLSNGTKTTELSVKEWKEFISFNNRLFDVDDKSATQNVWIRVTGKSSVKEATELNTL